MSETCDEKKVKRKFLDAWLNDDRFKSWISKVSFDDSLFHCIICNKNFSCSSLSHVIRHAESAQHQRNIEENTSSFDEDNENVILKKKPLRKKTFMHKWLEVEKFKPWLREAKHDGNAFICIICNKTLSGGLSQICRHAECKLHKDNSEKCDIQTNESNYETLNMQTDESLLQFEDQKKSAESRYAALIADRNIPHETAKMILNFFQDIGENPNVLKSMKMGRTKCTNIILNVLGPVETNRVVENIQNTKFSIFIDEMTDTSNEKWMMFYVRYVNFETLQVHEQLVKLIDVDATDCSTEKLFNAFEQEMWKLQIPFSNITALSCNNALAMTGKYLYFKNKLEEVCKNVLTLSCPCHSTTLVAHAACAKLPQVCEEFMKKFSNYINNYSTRMAIFPEFFECFQDKKHKIVMLPNKQWLFDHKCIEKLTESWDIIMHLLSKTTKINADLLCIMQNVDVKAYLLFLRYILQFFNMFSTFFQTVKTRIYLLQQKSMEFLTKICVNFIKTDILKDLPNIAFDKIENHKRLTDINLGSECEEYLCQMIMDGYASVVITIRQNCLQFYVTTAKEICKRLPVNDTFLSKLKVFLPSTALLNIDRETSFNDISFIAKNIGDFDENGLKTEWCTLNLDFTIIEKQSLSKLDLDDMWTQILQRQYSTNEMKYPNLKILLNSIRSFPNSNIDSERIFSFLSDIKTNKRNKLTSAAVNAIRVIKSALKTRGETALSMKIDAKHLSLMSSGNLYAHLAKEQDSLQLHTADDDVAGPSSSNDTQQ